MLIFWLVMAAGAVIVCLMFLAFARPDYYTRCVKFFYRTFKHALGKPTLTPEQEEARNKAKNLAPYMTLVNRIEHLISGQILRFSISDTWGGEFITVALDTRYQQDGKKYIVSIENAINGMPAGKSTVMYTTDKLLDIATSIIDRDGKFVETAEKPVIAEKVTMSARKEISAPAKKDHIPG